MGRSETGSRLYLIIPADMNPDMVLQLAESGCFGKFSSALLQSRRDGKVARGDAEMLLRFTRAASIPLLFADDISAAAELGADGVHIPADEDIYAAARRTLGDNAIIGVDCGLSRHAGLTLGEMGADYIAFRESANAAPGGTKPGLEEMIAWWSDIVTIPCVAWDIERADDARRLADAGADFIAMGEAIWTHSGDPASTIAQFSASLTARQVCV